MKNEILPTKENLQNLTQKELQADGLKLFFYFIDDCYLNK